MIWRHYFSCDQMVIWLGVWGSLSRCGFIGPYFVWVAVGETLFWVAVGYFEWGDWVEKYFGWVGMYEALFWVEGVGWDVW